MKRIICEIPLKEATAGISNLQLGTIKTMGFNGAGISVREIIH